MGLVPTRHVKVTRELKVSRWTGDGEVTSSSGANQIGWLGTGTCIGATICYGLLNMEVER